MSSLAAAALRLRFAIPAAILVGVQTIFAGYTVLTSVTVKSSGVSPLVFAFLRDVIGTICLLGFVYWRHRRTGERFLPLPEDWGFFLLLGLFGVWGSQGLSAVAISLTTANYFSCLEPLIPVVALVMGLIVGYERFHPREWTTWGKIGGVCVAVAGAIYIVVTAAASGGDIIQASSNFAVGTGYLVLQILLASSYLITQKRMLNKGYPSVVVAGWAYALGTGLLLLSVITSATTAADWNITLPLLGTIAYSGILASGLNYGLMAMCNQLINPVFVAAFSPVQTVATVLLSWALQGTKLAWDDLYGSLAVTGGLLLLVSSQYLEQRALTLLAGKGHLDVASVNGERSGSDGSGGGPGWREGAGRKESKASTLPLLHDGEEYAVELP